MRSICLMIASLVSALSFAEDVTFQGVFNDIANAIIERDGGGVMTPSQMAERIESLPRPSEFSVDEIFTNGVPVEGQNNYLSSTFGVPAFSLAGVKDIRGGTVYAGDNSFWGLSDITNIYLPYLIYVGVNCFRRGNFNNCKNLTFERVAIINNDAFYESSCVEEIHLPCLSYFGMYVFESCNKIRLIDIPNCKSFSGRAFAYSMNFPVNCDIMLTNKTYSSTAPWTNIPFSEDSTVSHTMRFQFTNGVVKYVDGVWSLFTDSDWVFYGE